MTGPRPTATSSSSASRTSPPSTVTATPSSVVLTLWNGVPVRKRIPRLRKARSSALERRLVLGGDEPRQGLDDRHLGAEAAPDAGELAADDTAAQHDRPRPGRGPGAARARS